MVEKVLENIKTDHEKIMKILNELEISDDAKRVEVLFKSLKKEMIDNMNKEEKCIYEKIKKENDLKQKDEHHLIKNFLQRLNLIRIDNNQWKKFFLELKLFFEGHALNEQKAITKIVKNKISIKELKEILEDLNNSKNEV